jgi:IS30 family transposase
MLESGFNKTEIAIAVGVHKSTIGREIKRNCDLRNHQYRADLAHRKSIERHLNKPKRVKFTAAVQKYVEKKLKKQWSPEQISKSKLPKGLDIMVSHERIYQHIISDKKQGGVLYKHKRRQRKYRPRIMKEDRRGKIINAKPISQRPPVVDQRTRYGDYEVDLIIGSNHQGAILTLTERKTGIGKLRLLKSKSATVVSRAIIEALKKEKGKIHTITSDNGKEFADHQKISKKLGIDFYFADPYSSWQRGSNENYNGLVRQYFPKKTDFTKLAWSDVKKVENRLNKRPRKRHKFRSPIEEYNLLTKVAFAA